MDFSGLKFYKYEIQKAIDRAVERANKENKNFVVVISKRRFVQIGQNGFSKKDEKNWILLKRVYPKNRNKLSKIIKEIISRKG